MVLLSAYSVCVRARASAALGPVAEICYTGKLESTEGTAPVNTGGEGAVEGVAEKTTVVLPSDGDGVWMIAFRE